MSIPTRPSGSLTKAKTRATESYNTILEREINSLKCYSIHTNAIYPHSLILGTSLGVIALSINRYKVSAM